MSPNSETTNIPNGHINPSFIASNGDLSQLETNVSAPKYDFNQNRIEPIENSDEYDIKKRDLELSVPSTVSDDSYVPPQVEYEVQSAWAVLRQMLIPFTVAGFGSVFAGIVLNAVTKWTVFEAIPQLEIMVPAFLGLIGNIETTLASRLSTHANLGTLDTWAGLSSIMLGNFLVVECQASTVGLFAALASLLMSTLKEETRNKITMENSLLIASSSVVTSIITNTVLATVIAIVIILSRRFRINPDNISTPFAASMGDVCSIAILALISQRMFDYRNQILQISFIVVFVAIAPIYGYFARKNRFSRSVIYSGWTAILGAVVVEQPGGMVMQSAFEQYKVLSTFQPLVNGRFPFNLINRN